MSKRMDGYRKAAGLDTKKKRGPRKKTIWEMVKKAFSYERDGIVKVSTIPFITESWVDGVRMVSSFMVTLPVFVREDKVLESINLGFGWLEEEIEADAS